MSRNIIIVLIVTFTIVGCKKIDSLPEVENYSLEKGEEQFFEVNQEIYSINDEPIKNNYLVRDVVVEKTSLNLVTTYTLERYTKKTLADTWKIQRVYQLSQSPSELIELGETPVVKLVFPTTLKATFNINKYNNKEQVEANYSEVNANFGNYKNIFRVTKNADSTLINLRKAYEIYSPSEGLVFKETTNLDYCQSTPNCIGKGEIAFGSREIWRRIN